MREVELNECCDCSRKRPGYLQDGYRLCMGCGLYVISAPHRRMLEIEREMERKRKDASRGIRTKTDTERAVNDD